MIHDGASYQIHGTYPERRALHNDVDSTHVCPKRSRQRRVMTEKHRHIHSSLRGDTTDLSCGETRGALRQCKMPGCGKIRPLWWQGTREAAFDRPPLWFPCSLPPQRSRLATTRHLALPQRTSRLATRASCMLVHHAW